MLFITLLIPYFHKRYENYYFISAKSAIVNVFLQRLFHEICSSNKKFLRIGLSEPEDRSVVKLIEQY